MSTVNIAIPNESVGPKVAMVNMQLAIETGLVPFLHGSPAIGKSDLAAQIAENGNLKMIDVRLSQCDPTDLNAA